MHTDRSEALYRIRARRLVATHFVAFVAMSAFFIAIWAGTGSPTFWPIFPILGWGLGLAVHAAHMIGWTSPISEERIQRELERMS